MRLADGSGIHGKVVTIVSNFRVNNNQVIFKSMEVDEISKGKSIN